MSEAFGGMQSGMLSACDGMTNMQITDADYACLTHAPVLRALDA